MDENNTEQTTNSGLDSELDSDNTNTTTSTEDSNTTSTNSDTGQNTNTQANEETAADANTSSRVSSDNAVTGDDSQNVNSSNENSNIELGTAGTLSVVFGLVYFLLIFVALWKMLEKLGEKGWKLLIPFYNLYVLFIVAFGKNSVNNNQPKDEFNFDDNNLNNNLNAMNNFNNESQDYGTSMQQSSRLGTMDLNSHLNSEMNNIPNEMQGMNPNEPNNIGINNEQMQNPMQFPETGPSQLNNNMGMPNMPNDNNQMGMGPGPMMGPNPFDNNMEKTGMNQSMPTGSINEQPSNGNYNNGPMPIEGMGPGAMTKQCPNCHAPVPQNLVVCPNCGANVGGLH